MIIGLRAEETATTRRANKPAENIHKGLKGPGDPGRSGSKPYN